MLYGLVLTGGESKRMKTDKAALEFHGKKLSAYAFDILNPLCDQTFLSLREEQKNVEGRKGYPQIMDQAPFLNIGPIAGILSAFTSYPKTAWLVLACDLPLVTAEIIRHLITHRNKNKMATAYVSTHDQLPEPLCAIYEASAFYPLKAYVQSNQLCPRKFLINQKNIELLSLPDPKALENINYPEEYKKIIQ